MDLIKLQVKMASTEVQAALSEIKLTSSRDKHSSSCRTQQNSFLQETLENVKWYIPRTVWKCKLCTYLPLEETGNYNSARCTSLSWRGLVLEVAFLSDFSSRSFSEVYLLLSLGESGTVYQWLTQTYMSWFIGFWCSTISCIELMFGTAKKQI